METTGTSSTSISASEVRSKKIPVRVMELEPFDPGTFYTLIRPFEKTKFSLFQMSDSDDENEELFKNWTIIQEDSSDYDTE
jgi:hypothetical protein